MTWKILEGEALDVLKRQPDESVHCAITSPPYWGLRDYGVADQLGQEDDPREYIARLLGIFRELRRVLRSDGTLWVNIADTYAGSGRGLLSNGEHSAKNDPDCKQATNVGSLSGRGGALAPAGIKPKDLIGIPWMLAFAMRDDGWWLRQENIWSKPNPMVESVKDRCTKSHESIFLFTKSRQYFYDAFAINEPWVDRKGDIQRAMDNHAGYDGKHGDGYSGVRGQPVGDPLAGKNKRSVWEIPTSGYSEAHFATFPPALVEPMILAGTSENGVCARCGTPWDRILEKTVEEHGAKEHPESKVADLDDNHRHKRLRMRAKAARDTGEDHDNPFGTFKHLDWEQGCDCDTTERLPALVLDPFSGAGTTGMVALRFQRDYVGIELNPEYAEMSRRRIAGDAPLFNTPAPEGDDIEIPSWIGGKK